MGKIKSAVFTIIFTVVIAVLCAMCVVPTFTLPFNINGSVSEYRSVLSVMNLDSDMGGGYYSVYYPEGVISSSEYEAEYASKKAVSEDLAADYAADYVKHGALYLNADIVENGDADAEFKQDFEDAVQIIVDRYEALDLDYVKIDVADDYSVRIELSSEISDPDSVFSILAASGDFTLSHSSSTLPLLKPTRNYPMNTYFKKVSTRVSGDTPYVRFYLTDEGRSKVKSISNTVAADEDDQVLYFCVGDVSVISLTVDGIIDSDELYLSGYEEELSAKCVASLMNSCINGNTVELSMTVGETNSFDSVMGENIDTVVYIAVGIAMLAVCVYSALRYKGIGAAHIYGFLSYAICAIMCVSLIETVYLSLGGVIAVILGGVLMCLSNYYIFGNVKSEFENGKRISASMKEGYKKSLATLIDIHIILVIASGLMYFVGISALSMFGAIMAICTIISAACVALTCFYWLMLMGNVKNQFKFCNFKREVIDDED